MKLTLRRSDRRSFYSLPWTCPMPRPRRRSWCPVRARTPSTRSGPVACTAPRVDVIGTRQRAHRAVAASMAGESGYRASDQRRRVSRTALLHQAVADRVQGGLGPVGQAKLRQDVAHVRLDRLLGEHELPGDLSVGLALGDEPEHVHLSLGEGLYGVRPFLLTCELVHELGSDPWLEEPFPPVDCSDGEISRFDVLQQVARCPGLHG